MIVIDDRYKDYRILGIGGEKWFFVYYVEINDFLFDKYVLNCEVKIFFFVIL